LLRGKAVAPAIALIDLFVFDHSLPDIFFLMIVCMPAGGQRVPSGGGHSYVLHRKKLQAKARLEIFGAALDAWNTRLQWLTTPLIEY
jgi:hypothetical protein